MHLKRVRFVMEGVILAIILQDVFRPRRILFDSNTAIASSSLAIDSDA